MFFIFNLYFFISFAIIFSSTLAVFSVNPIYCLLWLVLSFLFSAGLLFLFGCEFLAFIFVIIYVGAIAILFLFVLMLIDLKIKNLRIKKNNSIKLAVLLGILFLLLIFLFSYLKCSNLITFSIFKLFIINNISAVFINWQDFINNLNELQIINFLFYDVFVLQFLLTGLLLLAVLIGVIFLTNSYQSLKLIDQSVFKQITVNSNFFYK